MRILILSFYYRPDLSAGSFRTAALVSALLEQLPDTVEVEVITTLPNRYDSFSHGAAPLEESPRLTVHRVELAAHGSGMLSQAREFVTYARATWARVESAQYDLVFGTSSRLMTAVLSAYIARKKQLPLYLDIRDIFVDTIKHVLPRSVAWPVNPLFSLLERWTIAHANAVNLVSPGFESYFLRRYPKQRYSYFTNGIDDEFIKIDPCDSDSLKVVGTPIRVLYAGNIGEGQGLHLVLPQLAKRLDDRMAFSIIGDGGRKRRLEEELNRIGCTNVELLPPMKREGLIEEYQNADVLFLHLNDYSAFTRVLPSKVFEYAATRKPVWAGVAGHAAKFIRTEIENAAVFPPCDVDQAIQTFEGLRLSEVPRTGFVTKYNRTRIMTEMAADIAQLLPQNVLTGTSSEPGRPESYG